MRRNDLPSSRGVSGKNGREEEVAEGSADFLVRWCLPYEFFVPLRALLFKEHQGCVVSTFNVELELHA